MSRRTAIPNARLKPASRGWALWLCLWLLAPWPSHTGLVSGRTHGHVSARVAAHPPQAAPADGALARPLTQGNSLERELAGGEVQTYRIVMAAGQYGHVLIDQQGIDVVVKAYGPGDVPAGEVDRPTSACGREAISLIADAAGVYTLRVQSLDPAAARGRYTIKLLEIRAVTPRDESRITAERAVTEGERLRERQTAGSFLLAIKKFEQAAALWRALEDSYEEAVALYGIGLSYRAIGEYQRAVHYFAKMLPLMQQLGDLYGQAIAQTGLAWAYLYLGEYKRALENFSSALAVKRSINDRRGEAVTLHGLAWVHALSNDHEAALCRFREALAIRRALNDRQGEALTLIGIGKVCTRIGRRKEGLDDLNRALTLLREVGDRYGEADALSSIGWALVSLGDYRRALDHFNQALILRRATGDRTGEATTLFGMAEAERQLGNLSNACDSMEAALRIIEALGIAGSSQELRMAFFASVQIYYEHYIELLQSLDRLYPEKGYAATALHASERARARSLLDLLAEIKVDIHQDVAAELLERERALQRQLNVAADRRRRLAGGNQQDREAAAAQVESLTRRYQEVEAQIRETSPRFATLTRPTPLTAVQIQQQVLDDGTMLLEYALGETHSYLWAVTPTALESFQLPKRSEIEAAARRVLDLMTARNTRKADETAEQMKVRVARADADYPAAAAALSRMLLGPVASRLGRMRLLIVPQGELLLIPFGALPLPSNGGPGETFKPLVVGHEITIMPSASTLAVLRHETASRPLPSKHIAVIADPVFSKDDERIRPPSAQSQAHILHPSLTVAGKPSGQRLSDEVEGESLSEHLPRLFATRWEAEQIMAIVPAGDGLLATDFNADRRLVFSGSLAQYRILHFATHALIDDVHPELSGVAMSLVDEAGRRSNGFLWAHEIYNLKLPVELVVLSGCRTGTGKSVRGEGLIGLTRGFMHAGAPRVLTSLWTLNDRAAAEMMVRFYKRMLGPANESPIAALRWTQIEMMKDRRWQAPYFWAAFVLQGDWQ